MKNLVLGAALLAAAATTFHAPAYADGQERGRPTTIAVFGDWPYNQNLLDHAPLLIDSVNADPAVSLVLHVGDIHSGSMPCTSAGILPPIATSDPGWNQRIYARFQQFRAPVIYTPGDNEWTDCHKAKEKSAGDPLKELAAVRSLFFARPGHSLGLTDMRVLSQAEMPDTAHPKDAQFVENVMWHDGGVVYVTLNVPGSNNDTLPWSGTFNNPAAQAQEVLERNEANQRWLQAAFRHAHAMHAHGVVIGLQADMWDPSAVTPGGDGLSAYTPFVRMLADLALHFQRPVLVINGDSHLYGGDRPLADPASPTGVIHGTPAVPNLQRVTVQGSTNGPAEWLRLTIDPHDPALFSWRNVPYCKDPLGSCL